jgi:hypothetical protein
VVARQRSFPPPLAELEMGAADHRSTCPGIPRHRGYDVLLASGRPFGAG